jgi:hypothetical protein
VKVLKLYHKKCDHLLKEPEIRFAGIVDKRGKLIAGGFKEGITPYENDETKLQSFFEFVSKTSIRKEFDESLGPINYLAARRDKAVLVSFPFPVTQILLLISAEPTVSIEILAKKVVEIFTDVN